MSFGPWEATSSHYKWLSDIENNCNDITLCFRLIDMGVDGFSTTVFCYGQTGSGKTHTLTGPPYLVRYPLFSFVFFYMWTKFLFIFYLKQMTKQKSRIPWLGHPVFTLIIQEKVLTDGKSSKEVDHDCSLLYSCSVTWKYSR